jgi:hypothetical protein
MVDLSALVGHNRGSMITLLLHLFRLLPFLVGGHRRLALENLALRQQLAFYKRRAPRPRLRTMDRRTGQPRGRDHGRTPAAPAELAFIVPMRPAAGAVPHPDTAAHARTRDRAGTSVSHAGARSGRLARQPPRAEECRGASPHPVAGFGPTSRGNAGADSQGAHSGPGEPPTGALKDAERAHILRILERCHGTIEGPRQAVERLRGLVPSTLRNRIRRLRIRRAARLSRLRSKRIVREVLCETSSDDRFVAVISSRTLPEKPNGLRRVP